MTLKGVVNLLHTGGAEVPPTDPVVTLATASADNKIRVFFDQSMRATNPGSSDDTLNPSNYVISTGVGAARVPVSIIAVQIHPTIVEITLDGEMTDGAAYNVDADNVLSVFGVSLNPLFTDANFTGQGTDPTIDSVTVPSSTAIVITFSEDMLNNAALTTPTNYHFAGPTTLVPTNVTRLAADQVRVTVNEMLDGGAYTVYADGIFDVALNPVDTTPEPYTGVGVGPAIAYVTAVAANEIRVAFTEVVDPTLAGNVANYDVYEKDNPTQHISLASATQYTPQVYTLIFSQVTDSGVLYVAETTGLQDLVGNVQDPNPDTEEFVGLGISPPTIDISPAHNAANVPIRRYVRVTMADVPTDFTGIDTSKVWIKVFHTDENGVEHESSVVTAGVFSPSFDGYTRGAADSEDGITYFFRPADKTWYPRQRYTVSAFGEDFEASQNFEESSFDTAAPECFEDLESAVFTALESKLLSPLGLYHVDQLREALLRYSTLSPVGRVQARTLLWLTAQTDLKGVLAGLLDFALVGEDVKLCDRQPITDVYTKTRRLGFVARRAVDEIPKLLPEVKDMIRDRLDNNSPVYVVNAMAVIVVAAAVFGELP